MITLTDGQRSYMLLHIVNGLQALGLGAQITPKAMEQQAAQLDRMLTDGSLRDLSQFQPPNPYEKDLAARSASHASHASHASRKDASRKDLAKHPVNPGLNPGLKPYASFVPPDPYAAALASHASRIKARRGGAK